jgi:hypothetical protein
MEGPRGSKGRDEEREENGVRSARARAPQRMRNREGRGTRADRDDGACRDARRRNHDDEHERERTTMERGRIEAKDAKR